MCATFGYGYPHPSYTTKCGQTVGWNTTAKVTLSGGTITSYWMDGPYPG